METTLLSNIDANQHTARHRFPHPLRLLGRRTLMNVGSTWIVFAGCVASPTHTMGSESRALAPPSPKTFSLPVKAEVSVDDLAYSPDGRFLATADDARLTLWDASNGRAVRTQRAPFPGFQSVTFSPDGKRYAAIHNRTLSIWDTQTGRQLRSIHGDIADFNNLCFFPDGRRILTGSWSKKAKVWDAKTGRLLQTFQNTQSCYVVVAVSRDSRHIATANETHANGPDFVRIWDAQTGRSLHVLAHVGFIYSVAFSPNGRALVASCGRIAKVWDVQSGHELLTLRGHENQVSSAIFTPDGRRICTGSADGVIKIWDVATGREQFALRGKEGLDMRLACSPDGKRLLASNGDGAKVWDIGTSNSSAGE